MSQVPGTVSPDGQWRWDGTRWVQVSGAEPQLEPVTNSWAICSLIASLAVPLMPLSSVAGIVFGVLALRQIDRSPRQKGRGLAVAGIVISSVVLAVIGVVLVALLVFSVGCRNGCFTY